MLTREEVHALTGHDVGGVCPFGINAGVAVCTDNCEKIFIQEIKNEQCFDHQRKSSREWQYIYCRS